MILILEKKTFLDFQVPFHYEIQVALGYLMISNAVAPLIGSIDIFFIFKLCKRKLVERAMKASEFAYSQFELNESFTNPKMMLLPKYCYLVRTIYVGLIYNSFGPYVSVLVTVGLLSHYLIEKFKIMYYYSKPDYHSSILVFSCVDNLKFDIAFQYLVDIILNRRNEVEFSSEMIMIGAYLAILILFQFPILQRFIYFFDEDLEMKDEILFKEQYLISSINYESVDPFSFMSGVSKYFKTMTELNIISNSEVNRIVKENPSLKVNPKRLYNEVLGYPHKEEAYGLSLENIHVIKEVYIPKESYSIN